MIIRNFKSKYINEDVRLVRGMYMDGNWAIRIVHPDTDEPFAVATVCLPEARINGDQVLLKGYSENEGIPAALEAAGVVGPALREYPTGFVKLTVHSLLVSLGGDDE